MINKAYLNEETVEKIKGLFSSNKEFPSIKLQDFLENGFYKKITGAAMKSKYKRKIKPMEYSYSAGETPKILDDFFNSSQFKNFISSIIDKKIKKIDGNIYKFEWKDYTLLHDKNVQREGFDIIFDFTDNWDEKADGKVIYTDGMGNYNYIHPCQNTLVIAHRKKNIQKFMQYINHHSGKNRRHIFMGAIS